MELHLKRAADEKPNPGVPVVGVLMDGSYDVVCWSKGYGDFRSVARGAPAAPVVYWHEVLEVPVELANFLAARDQLLGLCHV